MSLSSGLYYGFLTLFVWAVLRVLGFKRSSSNQSSTKIVHFVHLDLGVGGAERLVVDAAMSLVSKGHKVTIFTTNHPIHHCFPETKNNPKLPVVVHGNFIPHHFANKFQIICSILRMCYLSFKVIAFEPKADFIICDGVSACIPVLKLASAKIIFYCHYPDLLLTRKKSLLRTLYRLPVDILEEVTTALADDILVNSNFTKTTFKKTFKLIQREPQVVYPCVDVVALDKMLTLKSLPPFKLFVRSKFLLPARRPHVLFSINRFDPAKRVETAVNAFAELCKRNPQSAQNYQLIIAGGYEASVKSNVDYLQKLQDLAIQHGLQHAVIFNSKDGIKEWAESSVIFIPDVSEKHKVEFFKNALCTVYTPSFEHFGIVPVEAMVCQCPVIGVSNGGLLETVTTSRENGILCPPDSIKDFADAMEYMVKNPQVAKQMGTNGRNRAKQNFSLDTMANRLHQLITR